jgi:hypothetical protein
VITEDVTAAMLETYRQIGIFAHEKPVRQVVERIEQLRPDWIHPMHGGSFTGELSPRFYRALEEEPFAYRNLLFGREIPAAAQDAA